jgi:hypothetical protein
VIGIYFTSANSFISGKANQNGGLSIRRFTTGEEAKGLLEREAEPPEITHFEAAVFYLQTSVAERAKYCGGPHCPAPYFVATKRWQKYCTEECAGPALRESKRRWWTENRAKNGGNQ